MIGISIVIPTRGTSDHLIRLLDSIQRQKLDAHFLTMVIVNSATNLIFETIKTKLAENDLLNLEVLQISEVGVNLARNFGVERAIYPVIIFLDDDCELADSHLLQSHLTEHFSRPDLFALGGVYLMREPAAFFDRVYHFIQMRWLYAARSNKTNSTSHYLIGGHFSVKRELLSRYGIKFNPKITYGGSELEFFLAARECDLKVELSELGVLHVTNENIFSITRKLYRQGCGQALSEKNFPNQVQSSEEEEVGLSESFWMNACLTYFNYVFWLGYYDFKRQRMQYIKHFTGHFMGVVKFRRFKLLKGLQQDAKNKAQRGDRL